MELGNTVSSVGFSTSIACWATVTVAIPRVAVPDNMRLPSAITVPPENLLSPVSTTMFVPVLTRVPLPMIEFP